MRTERKRSRSCLDQISGPATIEQRDSGFTLIELLVVVSIVSILAAILFPVFARARENARRASCLSNLKQIGLATMMYVQDYDEKYLPFWNFQSATPPGGWIMSHRDRWHYPNLLYPYTKSMQVFWCPSGNSTDESLNSSYGFSYYIMNVDEPMVMASIDSPSTTYLGMDFGTNTIRRRYATAPSGSRSYLPGAAPYTGQPEGNPGKPITDTWALNDYQKGRHFDGVNTLFADGHTKWLKTRIVYDEARKGSSGAWIP